MKSTMRAPFVVAVACVVAGCATPEPSHGDLQKGAYRPPVRAPTFSPSEDAPHTFRPGQPSPVQPGPRPTRVLPETPETRRGPGIWASESPPVTDRGPEIFGTPPLEPEHADPDYVSAMVNCANMMRRASEIAGEDGSGLTPRGKACAAARLYLVCAEDWAKHAEPVARGEAERRLATALAYKERLCTRLKPTDGPTDGVVSAVTFRYNETQDLLRRKMERAR